MGTVFTVNGQAQSVEAPESSTLLDVLRNWLGLMGTRYGCGLEQCRPWQTIAKCPHREAEKR